MPGPARVPVCGRGWTCHRARMRDGHNPREESSWVPRNQARVAARSVAKSDGCAARSATARSSPTTVGTAPSSLDAAQQLLPLRYQSVSSVPTVSLCPGHLLTMPPGARMLEKPTQTLPSTEPSNSSRLTEILNEIRLRNSGKRQRLWRPFRLRPAERTSSNQRE